MHAHAQMHAITCTGGLFIGLYLLLLLYEDSTLAYTSNS